MVSFETLARAYQLVFGCPQLPTAEQVSSLNMAALKQAYRRRASIFHPDRAPQSVHSAEELARAFHVLKEAYDLLRRFVTPPSPPKAIPRAQRPEPSQATVEPARFGDFLVRLGLINRATLDRALMQQRSSRPSFGAIATFWGVLKPHQTSRVELQKQPGEPIATAAVRLGYLSKEQASQILRFQRSDGHQPLGKVLIDMGCLTPQQVSRGLAAYDHLRTLAA